ncbi:hypothetical protein CYMTET_13523 [Cymbomonas tetramitiformis]|uniref:Uncharacterized protein n=1 Tax=Cymbomonas tetramitiformis TaxID=36881 RepID=A0AAE0GIF6_9CHLO|nr:hypothetical protein CYMTET_13523 [Cymbomonas tetramitiformis]
MSVISAPIINANHAKLSSFKCSTRGLRARGLALRSTRVATLDVRAENVLIVNTKGGGHAPFGLYLAKELSAAGHQITILNDGDPEKLASKAPFSEYPSIPGASVVWGNPTDPASFPSGHFDVVYDNNGKDLDNCKPLIDTYSRTCTQYCFVSSAGMAIENEVAPMIFESTPCNPKKGHFAVEEYLKTQNVPYTIFRPLYPYGKFTMKDCEQWFMDRILRDRPVPIPGDGLQLVGLSNYEDCGKVLAAAALNPKAIRSVYNLTSDTLVSFNGVAQAVAKAAGKEAIIVNYNPNTLGKGAWPFRLGHFFASSAKSQAELGVTFSHTFEGDMQECLQRYMAAGRLQKEVDFSKDDEIIKSILP